MASSQNQPMQLPFRCPRIRHSDSERSIGLYILSFIAGMALAADQSALFIGNSYTMSGPLDQAVETLLEEGVQEWADVQTQKLAGGGMFWSTHLNNASTEGHQWNQTLAEQWDWVVLQEQSQTPGFPMSTPQWQESLDAFLGLDSIVADQGGNTVLLMTWGRRDGDPSNDWLYPDFETMQGLLRDGYLAYAEAAATADRSIFIAPAGMAFWRLKESAPDAFSSLYSADGSHPSNQGSHMVACVLYSTITGRSPVGLTSSVENGELHQQVAEELVLGDPFGPYSYPWAWTDTPPDGRLSADGIRPHLQFDEELELDLAMEDAVLWITGGELVGDISMDSHSEVELKGGTFRGAVSGSLSMTGGELHSPEIGGELLQSGGLIWVDELHVQESARLTSLDLAPGAAQGSVYANVLVLDELALPADLEYEFLEAEGSQQLRLWRDHPEDTGANLDSGEVEEESEEPADEPEENSPQRNDSGTLDQDRECGCSSAGSGTIMHLATVLWLFILRRKEKFF
jgi:hypothetical protein